MSEDDLGGRVAELLSICAPAPGYERKRFPWEAEVHPGDRSGWEKEVKAILGQIFRDGMDAGWEKRQDSLEGNLREAIAALREEVQEKLAGPGAGEVPGGSAPHPVSPLFPPGFDGSPQVTPTEPGKGVNR